VINGRNRTLLDQAADEIRAATGADVTPVAADVSTAEGQAALLAACPSPDILINNNGGPPYRDFRELDRRAMLAGVTMNMVTPIELIQKVIDGMATRGFGRIVNITSITVKMPLPGLDLSSAARAGLTAFVAGVARKYADKNITINNLLPGSFDTQRLRSGFVAAAKKSGQPESRPGGAGDGGDSRQAIRHSRGARANLCFSLQRPRRVPHRSEHPAGRRSVSRRLLSPPPFEPAAFRYRTRPRVRHALHAVGGQGAAQNDSHFLPGEHSPLTLRERAQCQRSDSHAHQPQYRHVERFQQSAYLPVAALLEHDLEPRILVSAAQPACGPSLQMFAIRDRAMLQRRQQGGIRHPIDLHVIGLRRPRARVGDASGPCGIIAE